MTNPEQGAAARIGTTLDDPASGTSMPGFFRVELDRLPQLLADLEAVRDKYDEIHVESLGLRDIPAPGKDEVSTRAAVDLSKLAGDADGQLGWCAKQAQERVQAMIEEINQIIATYRDADDASEMGR